eukprot:TRINITY_DN1751_c0_g1_i2.p1 TRINITY_DN1751_c0_g1~~TRINITY_DN1751_c0_g1_i2.p1  ORF type:complete len:454 (-),score=71.96 TRINITY_DN1751_c0_g1_i2:56-1417(-)
MVPPPPTDIPPLDDPEASIYAQRARVLAELCTTEFDYVKDLKFMIRVFLLPLQFDDYIQQSEVVAIFSNVEALVEFNETLYKQMSATLNFSQGVINDPQEFGRKELGRVFLALADFLKIYVMYCMNHVSSLEVHAACMKKYKAYNAFVKDAQENQCNGLLIKDYLIKPVQRLCKYPLLFRELLASTPESHPDYAVVKKTLEKVNEVTAQVNQHAANRDNMLSLSYFDENVTGYGSRMVEFLSRSLIIDEILSVSQVVKNKVPKGQDRHVYLFNDVIIFTKPSKKKEVFKDEMPIDSSTIVSNMNIEEFSLRISTGGTTFVLYCPNRGILTKWNNHISNHLSKLVDSEIETEISTESDSTNSVSTESGLHSPKGNKRRRRDSSNRKRRSARQHRESGSFTSRESRNDEDPIVASLLDQVHVLKMKNKKLKKNEAKILERVEKLEEQLQQLLSSR